ncbi:MAG: hypothetical protein QOK04_2878 [Solirubrobacteraceae bacterium]|jgi:hypothetical protein|nr:hypothetical protein [Solirubrobacteraceae bacterium]
MTANDPPPQMSAQGDEPRSGGPAPGGPDPGSGPEPRAPRQDPLEALRERIRRTQDAVERLADEAAQAAPDPGEPGGTPGEPDEHRRIPPRGYATGGSAEGQRTTTSREAEAVVALLDLVRGLVPGELQHQLTELVRELLLLVRALIDWYLDRLEARRRRPVEVEDIPIS